jgi:type IV secretion system protein VirB9
MLHRILFIIIAFVFISKSASALVVEPRSLAYDSRMKVLVYKPGYVYKYTGHFKHQTHIKFEHGETIQTMSLGKQGGWDMAPSGSRLFLMPLNKNAQTTMTLITNKRLYYFELDAREATSIHDRQLAFEVKFLYPNTNSDSIELVGVNESDAGPDMSDLKKYNFNYTFSGADQIAPVKIFDDGDFTYFEFSRKNVEIPAIFYVDSKGFEGLVNFRVQGNFVVVQRLSEIFTLRHGTDTICVFNENLMKMRESLNPT